MGRYHSTENTKPNYLIMVSLAVLVAAGIFYYSRQQVPEQVVASIDLPVEQTSPIQEEPVATKTNENPLNIQHPSAQEKTAADEIPDQETAIPLPPLPESDAPCKQDLTGLSNNLNPWLNTDQLITKYLKIINDASQGQRQFKHMRFLKPSEPFTTKQDEQGLYIDPQSYRRYDELAAAIDAMDIQGSLKLYKKYRPLYQQVFTAFGYPEQYEIEDIFKKTAAIILEAPVIEERIYLTRPTVRYKFKNNRLEKLDPLQKQMIRMGPINTRIIQHKVRLMVEALVNQENL